MNMWQHRFDLIAHLERQRKWSENTFGPFTADRAHVPGVIDHLREEIEEVEKEPTDVTEWIDVMILAMDGAMRMGFSPHQIAEALDAKQTKNEGRKWPDWRTQDPTKKIKALKPHVHEMQSNLIDDGLACRVPGCNHVE